MIIFIYIKGSMFGQLLIKLKNKSETFVKLVAKDFNESFLADIYMSNFKL